jgi:hypothetical protein
MPIECNFEKNIIDGINLCVEIFCGGFIFSYLFFFTTEEYPLVKETEKAKILAKGKLRRLRLIEYCPNGKGYNSFKEYMKPHNFDLYKKIFDFSFDSSRNTGVGILRDWEANVAILLKDLLELKIYFDIEFYNKVDDIRHDYYWRQINDMFVNLHMFKDNESRKKNVYCGKVYLEHWIDAFEKLDKKYLNCMKVFKNWHVT